MVIRGRVHNGVVVLGDSVQLPEGQEVAIVALATPANTHGVLDIATVSLGAVLQPETGDDDLLGEMLEGRP